MRDGQLFDSPEEAAIHEVSSHGSPITATRSGQRDSVYGIEEMASTIAEWAGDRGYDPKTRTYRVAS
jgi:hypothetical protein